MRRKAFPRGVSYSYLCEIRWSTFLARGIALVNCCSLSPDGSAPGSALGPLVPVTMMVLMRMIHPKTITSDVIITE